MLAQTSFFHHATHTGQHTDITRILHAQGATRDGDMLPSVMSKYLHKKLGTLRREPMDFNALFYGPITCDGVLQPALSPSALAAMLSRPGSGLGDANVVKMRDETVDKLHAWLRKGAKSFQLDLLEQFANTQQQARSLQDRVVSQLSAIQGNGTLAQLQASLVLFKMNVSPVTVCTFDFGGDNHGDPNLAGEVSAHAASLATLAKLPGLIDAAGLNDQVSFCMLNVFGRSLVRPERNGREHNGEHAVSLLIGANVRGGVVGGVAPKDAAKPYFAQAFDSATGSPNAGGDVPFTDTLSSCGKTLLAAVGMSDAEADDALRGGKVVTAALNA